MAGDTSVNPLEGLYTLQSLHTKAAELNIDAPSRTRFQDELTRLLGLPASEERANALEQLSSAVKAHRHNFSVNLFELERLRKPEAVKFYSDEEVAQYLGKVAELEQLPLGDGRAEGLQRLNEELAAVRGSRLATHPFLEQLLNEEKPSRIQEVLPKHSRGSYREAVEAALTLPEGPVRAKLLTALNSGVNAAASSREHYKTVTRLSEALKAKSPTMSAIHSMLEANNRSMDRLLTLFRDCHAKDTAKPPARPGDGYMFYFEHEMYVHRAGLEYRGNELLGIAQKDTSQSEAEDTAPSP